MDPADVVAAFAAAYEPYVRERLVSVGAVRPVADGPCGPVFPDAVEAELGPALAEGHTWLTATLNALVRLPYRAQPRGPLEVFQEAMQPPTEALARLGVAGRERDPVAVAALPGDIYDLAPASSRELGDEVWETHMRWGAAKAAAMARPAVRVGYLGANLMDRSRIEAAVRSAGFELVTGTTLEDVDSMPGTVFVDLEVAGADALIRALAPRIRIVAFGPHVNDVAMVRAKSLGATDAIPRSRFFRDVAAFLPTVL
jgi:hypothetical protein